MSIPELETITISVEAHIATVRLNRPEKMNAMNLQMWHDIRSAFRYVDDTPEIRVAVLEGEGKAFTAGIDLQMMMGLGQQIQNECDGRMRESLRRIILDLQDTLTSLERCRKPVLAAVHGACVGGGIDLITCADMRYCSSDAWFTIKEIDIGMTADVGTLQRLPRLIGEGMARELAYTARKIDAAEAKGNPPGQPRLRIAGSLARRRTRDCRRYRLQGPAGSARREGNDHLRARPLDCRRSQLQRHLERRHADVGRSAGSHDVQHGQARPGIQRLSAKNGAARAAS
jgi:enoyl-CoA hydratase/carnithine racemase